MPVLEIILDLEIKLDGDGAMNDVYPDKLHAFMGGGVRLRVILLKGGMASGKHSVAIAIESPTGEWYMAETSYALFEGAARALGARVASDSGGPSPRLDGPGIRAEVVSLRDCLTAVLLCDPIENHNEIVRMIEQWTPEQRVQAYNWAMNTHLAASDNDDINPGPMPEHVRPTQRT